MDYSKRSVIRVCNLRVANFDNIPNYTAYKTRKELKKKAMRDKKPSSQTKMEKSLLKAKKLATLINRKFSKLVNYVARVGTYYNTLDNEVSFSSEPRDFSVQRQSQEKSSGRKTFNMMMGANHMNINSKDDILKQTTRTIDYCTRRSITIRSGEDTVRKTVQHRNSCACANQHSIPIKTASKMDNGKESEGNSANLPKVKHRQSQY